MLRLIRLLALTCPAFMIQAAAAQDFVKFKVEVGKEVELTIGFVTKVEDAFAECSINKTHGLAPLDRIHLYRPLDDGELDYVGFMTALLVDDIQCAGRITPFRATIPISTYEHRVLEPTNPPWRYEFCRTEVRNVGPFGPYYTTEWRVVEHGRIAEKSTAPALPPAEVALAKVGDVAGYVSTYGKVQFVNDSDQPITVHPTFWVDKQGKRLPLTTSWTISAGETNWATLGDEPLVVSKLEGRISSNNHSWTFELDKHVPGQFIVKCENDEPARLAEQRRREEEQRVRRLAEAERRQREQQAAARARAAAEAQTAVAWKPESGPNWFEPGQSTRRSAPPKSRSVSSEARNSAILKILGAYGLNVYKNSVEEDIKESGGSFLGTVLRVGLAGGAAWGRNKLVESAISDVFPELSSGERRAARVVLVAIFSGNFKGELKAAAEDEIIQALKGEHQGLHWAEVAGFLLEVYQARETQRSLRGELDDPTDPRFKYGNVVIIFAPVPSQDQTIDLSDLTVPGPTTTENLESIAALGVAAADR